MDDLISRQAAIHATERHTKDCNPEHFFSRAKFINYMDDESIGSFGQWQFNNGFNAGLVAVKVDIKNLPSVDKPKAKWKSSRPDAPMFGFHYCSICGRKRTSPQDNYCPNCGAKMEMEE